MLHLALWTAAITSAQLQNLTLYHVTRAQSIRQLIVDVSSPALCCRLLLHAAALRAAVLDR
jgi:hypothetical protein